MGLVMFREVDFVRGMGVATVRHVNDGRELVWLRNFSRGFEIFTSCVKIENLARSIGSHCFKFYGRVPGHGTRFLVFVIEKEPEARWHIGFNDGDFYEAVTEVHEQAVVWSAFDVSTAMGVCARTTRVAVAFAAKMLNDMEEAESLNRMVQAEGYSPASDPRQPAAKSATQRNATPKGQTVGGN
jgi:hypothetical protein